MHPDRERGYEHRVRDCESAAPGRGPLRPHLRRHGGPPDALPVRHQGPADHGARLRQRRARVRDRHRRRRTGSSTWASTATTCGCSTTAPARTCRRASRSSTSTTSPCATGRRRSRRSDGRPAVDEIQALGHCIGGLSLFMAIGGGMHGPALGHVQLARRPPDPDARQPGARARAAGDDLQAARDQGPQHRLRPEGLGRQADRDGDEGCVPFRHIYDNPVARRIFFIYGDVFD